MSVTAAPCQALVQPVTLPEQQGGGVTTTRVLAMTEVIALYVSAQAVLAMACARCTGLGGWSVMTCAPHNLEAGVQHCSGRAAACSCKQLQVL